jgi:hypothetical protein
VERQTGVLRFNRNKPLRGACEFYLILLESGILAAHRRRRAQDAPTLRQKFASNAPEIRRKPRGPNTLNDQRRRRPSCAVDRLWSGLMPGTLQFALGVGKGHCSCGQRTGAVDRYYSFDGEANKMSQKCVWADPVSGASIIHS